MASPRLVLVFVAGALAGSALAAEVASPHDITSYPLVWHEAGMDRVEVRKGIAYGETANQKLTFDLYLPPGRRASDRLPVVLFLNGVGDSPRGAVKDWEIYSSWMRFAAARGYAAAMGESDPQDVAGSLRQFLAAPARHAELGLDPERIGTFAVSANVSTAFPLLMEPGATRGVRAAVFYYGNGDAASFRADLPVFHVLAGKDGAGLIAGERRMWERAREAKAPWTMVDAPTLPHAFDAVDTSPESFAAIAQTLAFWDAHLKPAPPRRAETEAGRDARLGIAAVYGQEWARAEEIYLRIVQREPGSAGAWSALAWAQQSNNRLAEAEASLLKALALDPNDRFAVRRLGIVQAKRDRCAEAEKTLAPVLAATNDAMAASELGLCALRTNDPRAAVPHFEKAAEASPAPFFRYNLACALARSGQADRALATLEPLAAMKFGTRTAWSEDPDLSSLRADTRFQALLARLDP